MKAFSGFLVYLYSRTPEIDTADLSQFHAGLNLSQFQTDCLLRINSITAIFSYLKLFESILVILITLAFVPPLPLNNSRYLRGVSWWKTVKKHFLLFLYFIILHIFLYNTVKTE